MAVNDISHNKIKYMCIPCYLRANVYILVNVPDLEAFLFHPSWSCLTHMVKNKRQLGRDRFTFDNIPSQTDAKHEKWCFSSKEMAILWCLLNLSLLPVIITYCTVLFRCIALLSIYCFSRSIIPLSVTQRGLWCKLSIALCSRFHTQCPYEIHIPTHTMPPQLTHGLHTS